MATHRIRRHYDGSYYWTCTCGFTTTVGREAHAHVSRPPEPYWWLGPALVFLAIIILFVVLVLPAWNAYVRGP